MQSESIPSTPKTMDQFTEITSKRESEIEEDPLVLWLVDKIDSIIKKTDQDPKLFDRYYKRIQQLSEITGRIGSKKLQEKISIFAIHYLLKGAKIPLLPQNQNKFDLPFLDYCEVIKPTYYRSNTSGLNKLYEDFLKNNGYGFLFKGPHDHTVCFVKSRKITRLFKGNLEWENLHGKQMKGKDFQELGFEQQLKALDERLSKPIGKKIVLDISPLLVGKENSPLSSKELEERMTKIDSVITKNSASKSMICGMSKIFDGQDFILIFGQHPELRKIVTTLKKIGYRPDLPALERSLVKQRFNEHLLARSIEQSDIAGVLKKEKLENVESEGTVITILEQLNVLERLTKDLKEKYPIYNYYSMLLAIFTNLTEIDSIKTDKCSEQIINQSISIIIEKLEKHQSKIKTGNIDFNDFLVDVDLIVEEIILLSCFLDAPQLKETITDLATQKIKVDELDVAPQGYVYTSGMNAFTQLLFAIYRSTSLPSSGGKLTVGVVDNSYYETESVFIKEMERIVSKKTVRLNVAPTNALFDVIFADLYSNNAPILKAEELDFAKMFPVKMILNKKGNPLTLIIDTSTSIFYDDKVRQIVDYYKEPINKGKLNLVFINSLAKFSMCGFDKYQGGAIIVFNNNEGQFNLFNENLKKFEKKEKLSDEANSFFNIFLKNGDEILAYKNLIVKNTQHVYSKLLSNNIIEHDETSFKSHIMTPYSKRPVPNHNQPNVGFPKGIFLVKRKSEKIPSIPIHFGEFIEDLWCIKNGKKPETKTESIHMERGIGVLKENICPVIRDYIAVKARKEGLPLYPRQSFGFPHSSISENGSALRLTIGLEEQSNLDSYVRILIELDNELRAIASNDDLMKKLSGILSEKSSKKTLVSLLKENDTLDLTALINLAHSKKTQSTFV